MQAFTHVWSEQITKSGGYLWKRCRFIGELRLENTKAYTLYILNVEITIGSGRPTGKS